MSVVSLELSPRDPIPDTKPLVTVTFERTVVHQRDGASYYEFRYCRITKKEREYHFRIHSAVGVMKLEKYVAQWIMQRFVLQVWL